MTTEAWDLLVRLSKHYESLHDGDLKQIGLQPKMCPTGYWTEGYGSLVLDAKGKPLKGKENKDKALSLCRLHTEADATADLIKQLEFRIKLVDKLKLNLSDTQKAAVVSFMYNVGYDAFVNSTLYKRIKNSESATAIDIEFRKWSKGTVDGELVVLKGLEARRLSESLLFTKGELKFFN